jgi:hypothetical protein
LLLFLLLNFLLLLLLHVFLLLLLFRTSASFSKSCQLMPNASNLLHHHLLSNATSTSFQTVTSHPPAPLHLVLHYRHLLIGTPSASCCAASCVYQCLWLCLTLRLCLLSSPSCLVGCCVPPICRRPSATTTSCCTAAYTSCQASTSPCAIASCCTFASHCTPLIWLVVA